MVSQLMDRSSRNFQYLQLHQFYTLCAEEFIRTYDRSAVIDVRVTSCLDDFDANKVLRETLSLAQFLLELISLHEITENNYDYHMAISDFQNFEN